MKLRKILGAALLLAALLGTGCFKEIGYNTFYVLMPWVKSGTERPVPIYNDVLLYAFVADTAQWDVLSYQDAVDGVITSRTTGEKMQPVAQGEPYVIDGNENWLAMQIDGPRLFILAVDTQNRLYGFMEQLNGGNVPQLYVSVTFFPKEKKTRYKSGRWLMCNDFYVPDPPETPENPENPDVPETPEKPNPTPDRAF